MKAHFTANFPAPYNHLADSIEVEAVALDAEDPVEVDVSTRGFKFVSTKTGIVGCMCCCKPLPFSKTTTSDIVGLIAGDA